MRLRAAMYTTVRERCGIADYSAALRGPLAARVDLATVVLQPGRLNPIALAADARRLSRADVAHVQHTYSFFGVDQLTYTLAWRLLRRAITVPLVVTAHTVRPPGPARYDGGLGSALANALGAPAWHDVETFRRAELVIVHAALHRERLLARGIAPARCVVVPPGVPPAIAVPPDAVRRFRERHALGDRPVVGVFGFVERSKDFALMLDAVGATGAGPDGAVLLVAGGPRLPEHQAVVADLRAAAARAGLEHRLAITGYLPPADVPAALAAMDVVAVPYATDASVSYSVHVAIGQGRPVVATDVPTLRELAARGHCLALTPAGDPHALAKTLRHLLEDGVARERLVAGARAYARAASVDVAAERTLAAYHAALELGRA